METGKTDYESFMTTFNAIENEIKKLIIGQSDIIRDCLAAIIEGGNVLLEGLPGLGKTQLVKAIAKTLGFSFSRIQFTPDLMPVDITGTDIFMKGESGDGGFTFQKGPVFANIILADEINRATPKTQSALLEAMQERTVTSGSHTYELPMPFFVLATQNPLDMEGTYPLPEAQMDRFLMKLNVVFPRKDELMGIVKLTTGLENVITSPVQVCSVEEILAMGQLARQVPLSSAVWDYAMDIVMRTHPEHENSPEMIRKYVKYGSSPRGAQALVSIARIYALLDSRFNVAFDDIKKAARPVLRHRLFLGFEALVEQVTSDMLIDKLLE